MPAHYGGATATLGSYGSLPTAVVFTHSLLEPSMTFILSHAMALRRYQPVFAGSHRVNGLPLPADRVVVANRGGLIGAAEEFLFRRARLAGRLASSLRRFQPVLVHAHFGLSGPAALTLASALRVPLIVTYHGQDATISDMEAAGSWRGREYLRGRQDLMHRAGLIIAVSDFIRGKLLAKGYPEGKIVTHRNGIDLEYFRRERAERRERLVVFVGRFVEKKGCEYLLRALARLGATGQSAPAVLIGDGPLRGSLEHFARQSRIECEFKGFLPLAEVKAWLERASVVVVPSVTASDGDSEGLPTVILEAQAMGTPVIATRHAGNAEAVIDGRTAILVDERDETGLAQAIIGFLGEPLRVEAFGAAGRALVESQFNITAQVAGLELLYDRVRGLA